ncbi:hypothetical protein [Saccharothrix obliqua]|uniref:hypothetical protein n=1 Tax=Saccharothrix obliqua TaxID=2861747 RepID=UPI001C5DE11E|nr:hypothetical protein [Saccharothrix obliqua]MBW4721518.1 hypothetical protein [Saccharothrix obliqua]
MEIVSTDSTTLACVPWSHSESYGSAAGRVCTPGKNTGWVKDTKADGKCVFTETRWYQGRRELGRWRSPRACPKGDVKNFTSPQSPRGATTAKVYMGRD